MCKGPYALIRQIFSPLNSNSTTMISSWSVQIWAIGNAGKEQNRSENKFKFFKVYFTYTVYYDILPIARNLLETRENIKIEPHPFYHIICD